MVTFNRQKCKVFHLSLTCQLDMHKMGNTWFDNGSFPGGSDGKESACNAGDLGSISGLGRCPGGGHGNPFQYSCLESPHGQRSLAGLGS